MSCTVSLSTAVCTAVVENGKQEFKGYLCLVLNVT